MSKGFLTSEFWITMISIIAIVVVSFYLKSAAIVIGVPAVSCTYLWSRTRVKAPAAKIDGITVRK